MGKRETTLRQLIFMCLKEKLKEEGLTRTELHDLTDYILNNSTMGLTAENIELCEGNRFGVGDENKDKTLTIPRFLGFNYSKTNAYDFFSDNKKKSWRLHTYMSFDNLMSALSFQGVDGTIIIIDGEIIDYNRKMADNQDYIGYDVIFDTNIYKVSCFLEDKEYEEYFRSKKQLESRVIELVEKKADEISILNKITNEYMYFEINKNIYTNRDIISKSEDFNQMGLMWVRDVDDEDDEDWGEF